mmetsp:Transcript_11764/g.24677  ORF Transcript_11764/g.24677 Transcript_11764/m.24677 type:complete len:314 (+) Transcript_11764:771-1712(+)
MTAGARSPSPRCKGRFTCYYIAYIFSSTKTFPLSSWPIRISSSTYVSSSQPSGLKMARRRSKFFSKSACNLSGTSVDCWYLMSTLLAVATSNVASIVNIPSIAPSPATLNATSLTASLFSRSMRWTKSPRLTKLRSPSFVRLAPRICTVVYNSLHSPATFSNDSIGAGIGLRASSCSISSAICARSAFWQPNIPRSVGLIAFRSASLTESVSATTALTADLPVAKVPFDPDSLVGNLDSLNLDGDDLLVRMMLIVPESDADVLEARTLWDSCAHPAPIREREHGRDSCTRACAEQEVVILDSLMKQHGRCFEP